MSKTPGRRSRNRPPKPLPALPIMKTRPSGRMDHESIRVGIPISADLTIRLARPSEVDDLAAWQELAVSEPPQWARSVLARAAHSGVLSSALLAGLSGGHRAITDVIARGMTPSGITNEPPAMYLSTAAVLVAEIDGTVQGMLYAGPSPVLGQNAARLARLRSNRDDAVMGAHVCTVTGTSKIHFVSVSEAARGNGVGHALIATATKLYRRNEYIQLYGQFEAARTLGSFYQGAGFDVLAEGEGIGLDHIYGFETGVRGEPGERLFARRFRH